MCVPSCNQTTDYVLWFKRPECTKLSKSHYPDCYPVYYIENHKFKTHVNNVNVNNVFDKSNIFLELICPNCGKSPFPLQ